MHPNFESKIGKKIAWKPFRKEIEISSLGAQKAFKIESQNQFKIDENTVLDPLVPILLLPWTSEVLRKCQNGPQGAKMEAPSHPNGNRKELKGASGRRRSP